ncbi:MAG TPA: BMP family ABC transporter substrate-binding protein [Thermodesulfobacteriota bacterium]|jgi:basic membrane protein A|nr:BMP family ABC transporter substrate-binding protein [Thermodesulfobacteriota bacterium]
MRKKMLVFFAVLLVASFTSLQALSVAVVANDSIGDRGFTDMAYEGIKKAGADFKITYKVFECHNDSSRHFDTLKLAAANYDLIFVDPGYFFDKDLQEIAALYPNKTFVYIDGTTTLKNAVSVVFKQNEGAFLAGYLAASLAAQSPVGLSKGNQKVGFVGGADMPVIRDYQTGFEQGAAYANPKGTVIVKYAGTHYDPAKGKETAYSVFNEGASIIFQAAGPTGLGVLEAAKDYKFYAIGVDTDQGYLQPGFIISSMLKRVDTAVWDIVNLSLNGKLALGTTYSYGVANGGIGLAYNDYTKNLVPAAIWKNVMNVQDKIKNGEITVAGYSK